MPRIERTWSVIADQWRNWSTDDRGADEMLDALADLGDALSFGLPREHSGRREDFERAAATYQRWANTALVRSSQRNTMTSELRDARGLLSWVAPGAIFTRLPADWIPETETNVYASGTMIPGLKRNAADARTSVGAIRGHVGPHLKIADVTLRPDATDAIFAKQDARTISLIKCTYPDGWHDHVFGLMWKMNRLIFFGANGAGRPGDDLSQLSTNPGVRSLALVMTDFLHHRSCYEHLGRMHQLTTLALYRTMTREKTPGFGLAMVMDALDSLIRHGALRHLDIGHSTQFGPTQVDTLARALRACGGTLAISRNLVSERRDEGKKGDDEDADL